MKVDTETCPQCRNEVLMTRSVWDARTVYGRCAVCGTHLEILRAWQRPAQEQRGRRDEGKKSS